MALIECGEWTFDKLCQAAWFVANVSVARSCLLQVTEDLLL